jgi:hypothetical protein
LVAVALVTLHKVETGATVPRFLLRHTEVAGAALIAVMAELAVLAVALVVLVI